MTSTLERLTKPLESCLAGGKIADMTRRKEIPICAVEAHRATDSASEVFAQRWTVAYQ